MRGALVIGLCAIGACRFGFDGDGDDVATDARDGDGNADHDAPIASPQAPTAMRELCTVRAMTVIRGGDTADDTMAMSVASKLATSCAASQMIRNVSQDDAGILASNGRPLLAVDDVAIIAGGDTWHRSFVYLNINDTPLRLEETASRFRLVDRASNIVVLDKMQSAYNTTHDVAFIMLTYEPIGGASMLSLTGRSAEGTAAATYWFNNLLAPTIATASQRWYIMEWTNVDSDLAPTPPDTYSIVAMGP